MKRKVVEKHCGSCHMPLSKSEVHWVIVSSDTKTTHYAFCKECFEVEKDKKWVV